MSTRGAYGFRYNGHDKICFNHWDSYPSGLGENIVGVIRHMTHDELMGVYNNIILVDGDAKPNKTQIMECRKYADPNFECDTDWHWLLAKAQGKFEEHLAGLRYMIDARDFMEDEVFCEWAYIINLDTDEFEIYASTKLVKTFPLNDISNDWQEQI